MIELRKMTKEDVIKCGNIHYSAFYEKTNNRIINILGDEAKKLDDKIKNGLKFDFYFSQFIDDIDKYAYCRGISGKCGSKNRRIQRLCRESILT